MSITRAGLFPEGGLTVEGWDLDGGIALVSGEELGRDSRLSLEHYTALHMTLKP